MEYQAKNKTSSQYVIFPNHHVFATWEWIRTYEFCRVYHTIRKSYPTAQMDILAALEAAEFCDIADVRDEVLKHIRPSSSKHPTCHHIPEDMSKCLGDGTSFNELEKITEYNIVLGLPNKREVQIELYAPKLCRSNALNRAYGASKFIVVSLSEALARKVSLADAEVEQYIQDFFTTPLRIGDRVYHAFLRKEVR